MTVQHRLKEKCGEAWARGRLAHGSQQQQLGSGRHDVFGEMAQIEHTPAPPINTNEQGITPESSKPITQ